MTRNPTYICVLDFEATCDEGSTRDNEIIEFPSVLLELVDEEYIVISEFQEYCKPIANPEITKFCHDLTGISQEIVDASDTFPNVLKRHHKWLIDNTKNGGVLMLTVGHWDLGVVMISECKKHNIIPPKVYQRYINIKQLFDVFYKSKSRGMTNMLNYLHITLEGRHHSGIDDCRNTAKILQRIIADGCEIRNSNIVTVNQNSYTITKNKSKKN